MENLSRREAIEVGTVASIVLATSMAISGLEPANSSPEDRDMTNPSNSTLQEMAKRAKAISEKAYCPYSKFPVGAVILTDDGEMFEGCNVENASYGLTICAERNAAFQMVAKSKRKIAAVVIYTPTPKPSAPCGACRQVINEFGPEAMVMSICDGNDILKTSVSELLPDAFGPGNLK